MIENKYLDNLIIINRFIDDQMYVLKTLKTRLGVPMGITASDWSMKKSGYMKVYNECPFASIFKPHGWGINFKDEKVAIDFDFCKTGRIGGFDGWRLHMYCIDNPSIFTVFDHTGFNQLIDELAGEYIEKEDNLYFLKDCISKHIKDSGLS